MTPQEKADDLIDKITNSILDNGSWASKSIIKMIGVLIIDEILDSSDHPAGWDTFYRQVKTIIQSY